MRSLLFQHALKAYGTALQLGSAILLYLPTRCSYVVRHAIMSCDLRCVTSCSRPDCSWLFLYRNSGRSSMLMLPFCTPNTSFVFNFYLQVFGRLESTIVGLSHLPASFPILPACRVRAKLASEFTRHCLVATLLILAQEGRLRTLHEFSPRLRTTPQVARRICRNACPHQYAASGASGSVQFTSGPLHWARSEPWMDFVR